jgi:hydroxypyruvate reductase 1
MMVEGHKMDVVYYDIHPNEHLEAYVAAYSNFLVAQGLEPVKCKRAATVEDLLANADCVSIHTVLDESTHHLINAERLALMRPNAIIVNTSRGPVIDENALVAHCRTHPEFRAGLDVFENEPSLAPGLDQLENVVIVPHIASATRWTREGMATLAASNVAGLLMGYPVWNRPDILFFLEGDLPTMAPSILNAEELKLNMAD